MYLYRNFKTKAFEFQLIDEPKHSLRSISDIESCIGEDATNKALSSLSQEWAKMCQSSLPKLTKEAVLGLPKEYCLELSKKANLDHDTAVGFCSPDVGKLQKIFPNPPTPFEKAMMVYENKCAVCHTVMPHPTKMRERLESQDPAKRMPRDGTLTETERSYILSFIKIMGG